MCKMPLALRLIAPGALLLATMSCGLLDDATAFTVDTDWQAFIVNADALQVSSTEATVPSIDCSTSASVCTAASQIGCSSSETSSTCSVQCGEAKTCEIVAVVELGTVIDLSAKIKQQTSASALSKVSFEEMVYEATSNSLNFATPDLEVFIGPRTVSKTTDAGAVKFATLPAIPAGQTPKDQLIATSDGKDELSSLVKDYQNPFKWLVKATLRVVAKQALPQGSLSLRLKARFKVEPL